MTTSSTVVYLPRDYPSLSQTFVRNEIHGLRDLGIDVEVVATRWSLTENIEEGWAGPHDVAKRLPWATSVRDSVYWALRHPARFVRLWRLVVRAPAGDRWLALRFLPTLARRLRRKPVRVCHTHFAFDHAWATLYLAQLLDVPSSVTVHAADIYVDTAERVSLLNRFDQVVTVCDYNVNFLRSHGLRRNAYVVPCGVELPPRPDPRAPGFTVVSVGRMVPKKGFEGLIRAMSIVVQQVPNARLVVIGGGELDAQLRDLAADIGLVGHVEFLGAQPHPQVLEIIGRSDVFVLNCAIPGDGNTDAVPVVLREAMARERAVVSTSVAGIPEAVPDDCGWVVPPGDTVALAEAIIHALTDSDEALKRGGRARALVEKDYTIARCAYLQAQALHVTA